MDFENHFLRLLREQAPKTLNLSKNCLSERVARHILELLVNAAAEEKQVGAAEQRTVDLRSNWLQDPADFERRVVAHAEQRGVSVRVLECARPVPAQELVLAERPDILVFTSPGWSCTTAISMLQSKEWWDAWTTPGTSPRSGSAPP